MIVDLDKDDLISLIKGVGCPPYDMFDELANFGTFHASYDTWSWGNLETLTEVELVSLYLKLKSKILND